MYRTILVPLDGSKRAERILPHVEELAQRYSAVVIFLQVVEVNHHFIGPHESYVEIDMDTVKHQKMEAESYLASWRGEFREKGINAKACVEQGPVVKKIIDVAEREDVDLIAMASHGRGGLSRVFYGSVAAGVLQQIDRPLLLVRSRQDV